MKRMTSLAAILLGLSASAAWARPLTFGEINGTEDLSQSAELGAAPETDKKERQLLRNTFGGLEIDKGVVALNSQGRVRSLDIVLDDQDFDLAYQLLVGRYGKPTTTLPFPKWSSFDDGATIAISKSRPNTFISFHYPENEGPTRDIQSATVLRMSVLIAAGVLLGAGLARWRKRPRPRAAPAVVTRPRASSQTAPLSMRETLERKMREGDDLVF
jgi:hypothetical protein